MDLGDSLSDADSTEDDIRSLHLFGAIMANLIGNAIALPVIVAAGGLFLDETIPARVVSSAIVAGVVFLSIANIAWRKANLATHELGINTMSYLTPVLGLIWLFAFSQVGVIRVDYLIIGTAAILTANLLINFEAERLIGFKALVVALWACGTAVYLRSIEQGIWVGGDYFNALALSATVFILILSFRVARLSTRILDEDNRAFRLVRELDALARQGLIGPEVCEHVLTINEAEGADLQKAYNRARQSLAAALPPASPEDRRILIALEAELDALTHSRQQGINFGELSALAIFAGLIVSLAILARPDVSGVTAFLIDMFSILFSSVIIFLTFGIGDLQRDRVARIMLSHSSSAPGGYEVLFQDESRRHIEQAISVVVGLFIVVAYAGLLGNKWMGWFG